MRPYTFHAVIPWLLALAVFVAGYTLADWVEEKDANDTAQVIRIWGAVVAGLSAILLAAAFSSARKARAREAQALAVMERTTASVYIKDLEGRFLLVNKVCQDWCGLAAADMLGRVASDVFQLSDEVAEQSKAHDRLILDTARPHAQQRKVHLADGTEHDLMIAKFPIPGPLGEIIAIGSISTDVTDLVEVQRELQDSRDRLEQRVEERTRDLEREIKMRGVAEASTRASEERFRAIAESTSDWFWEMNENLEISYVSDRLSELLGLPNRTFLGKKRVELGAHDHRPDAVAAMRAHVEDLQARRPFRNFEYDLLDQSGHKRTISLSGQPVFDETGMFTGYRGAGTEVTKIREAERQLRHANEALEKRVEERTRELQAEVLERRRAQEDADLANRTKTEFLANMSHELRTPLNSIIGFSDVLDNEVFGPVGHEKYRDYVGHIRDSGQHLLALINDVFDVARIEVGMLELHDEPVDLRVLTNSCLGMVETRARARGITIDSRLEGLPRQLILDEIRFKQILLNLLTNAIKFSNPGGNVVLTGVIDNDGTHIFQVIDHGIGIAAEDIPKVLQPFGQVWGAFTRSHDGTGLGLSLASALAESHGGSLAIDSVVGEGTTVSVLIPADRAIEAKGE